MKHRNLGKTGVSVSALSLGGLFTSSLAGGIGESRRIVQEAIELGINTIDTAPAYADSEAVLGQALRDISAPIVLITKLGGRPLPFQPRDAAALRESVETSLRLLGRETLDGLMIHEPDRPKQYAWWTSHAPLDGPVLRVLEDLKQAGKVRLTGLAGTTTSELSALVRSNLFDLVLTAFNYNALYREAALDVIPQAHDRGMGIIVGSIYGQGFLGRRFDEEVRRQPGWLSSQRRRQFLALYELLDQSGLTIPELCLRFAIANTQLSTVLIGCKTAEQLRQSAAFAARGPLPDDVARRLDEIAAMQVGRPFEEPMILPFGKDYQGPGGANLGAGIPIGSTG